MKIAFLSSLYPPHTKGGGELSTHYIAQGLQRRGHDITVLTSGTRTEQIEIDGVQVQRLPLPLTAKPLLEKRHSRAIASALATALGDPEQYDVIHAHDFRTVLALAHLGYTNTVLTARDYAQICGSTNNLGADGNRCPGCTWLNVWGNHRVAEARIPRKFFRAWQYAHNLAFRQEAFRAISRHIYISHAQLDEISEQQDLSGIQTAVIYNPVSDEYLRTSPLKTRSRTILYVGTLENYKGVRLLLEAFHQLANDYHDVQLTVVGEGAQREQYEQLVSRWGLQYRVRFTGRIPFDQLRRFYDEARFLVAPHLWVEPFGRTVVEAMARGRVVIAANIGGPAEIIADGVTGMLFEKGSVTSLRSRLQDALSLRDIDRREMQTRARTWVEQHVSIDTIAQQYETVYKKFYPAPERHGY